jgi:RNA polymerase sigma factor (sigma-70 family)
VSRRSVREEFRAQRVPTLRGTNSMATLAPDSFEEVFLREYRSLVRLAAMISGVSALAEEIVQDSFVAALPRWSELRSPGAFMQRTVVNRSLNASRRIRRHRDVALDSMDVGVDDAEPADLTLLRAVYQLPRAQRAAVVLRFYADLSLSTMSDVLRRPVNTVKSDLRRALATLSKEVHSDE